ncbi:MAG: 4-(cytidine 5'-diphospho)-2-C-methyl-D-erythritol kinase [Verrucomicrobiales bacterium]
MNAIDLAAPAKINLWLRILRRRPDGFHDIETRMVLLDLSDRLSIEKVPEDKTRSGNNAVEVPIFTCSDPSLPVDGSNLVQKAVAAWIGQIGALPPLRIHLEKRIPHGAGLGGGSSDAAAALLGLNQLTGTRLDVSALTSLAAGVGSDVAFFLQGSPCDCSGRGEIVVPRAPWEPALSILLVKPPFSVSTPWAYQQWANARAIDPVYHRAQRWATAKLVNDLEPAVFAKHLLLTDLKMWLLERREVCAALMTGSGSCLFAILEGPSRGENLGAALRQEFGDDMWLCHTRTRLPGSG